MAEKEESGKGCCSFFSCCSGCAVGSLITLLVVLGGGFAGYYYLPGYLASKASESSVVLDKKNKPNPAAIETLNRKLNALSRELSSDGPIDVTATFSEKEVNAGIADTLLNEKSPLKLENAIVKLEDGGAQVFVRAEGKALASNMPRDDLKLREMLAKAGMVDVNAKVGVSVRDDKVHVQLQNLRIGPVPIPVFVANDLLKNYLKAQKVTFQGRTLSDLKIENGKVTVRATGGQN